MLTVQKGQIQANAHWTSVVGTYFYSSFRLLPADWLVGLNDMQKIILVLLYIAPQCFFYNCMLWHILLFSKKNCSSFDLNNASGHIVTSTLFQIFAQPYWLAHYLCELMCHILTRDCLATHLWLCAYECCLLPLSSDTHKHICLMRVCTDTCLHLVCKSIKEEGI